MAGYIGSKAVLLSTTAAEVSGDADIGGSVLVDTIKADNGTTAMTIDSSGDVTESNFCLSYWHKSTNSETISTLTVIDDWTEVSDGNGFKRIGGAFTESSGVFTFPRTGVYKLDAQFAFNKADATRYAGGYISFTSNSGGSYDNYSVFQDLNDDSSNTVYSSIKVIRYLNITDTSTHKVKFQFESATAVDLRGAMADTNVVFQRLAPPQS